MSVLADCDLLIIDCDGVRVDGEHLSIQARGSPRRPGHAIRAATVEGIWPVTRAIFEVELRATPGIEAFPDATGAVRRCVASSSDPERIAVSLGLIGLAPRVGQTDEIASVVAFLCSDASSLMTGAIVTADARYTLGRTAKAE